MPIKKADRLEHGQKKYPMNNSVTPTAQAGLDKLAHSMGVSRSELLERIGRGILVLVPETTRSQKAPHLIKECGAFDLC